MIDDVIGTIRGLFVAGAVLLLAGLAVPAMSTTAAAADLSIQSVSVTIGKKGNYLTDRDVNIPRNQVIADIENAISGVLAQKSASGGSPADVSVTISEINLVSAVERAVAGRSSMTGTVSVKSSDGSAIRNPAQVRGFASAIPSFGAMGVLTTKAAKDDYVATVNSFAKAVGKFVYQGG